MNPCLQTRPRMEPSRRHAMYTTYTQQSLVQVGHSATGTHNAHTQDTPRLTLWACTSASMRCSRDSGLCRRTWPPPSVGAPLRAAPPAGARACRPGSHAASLGSVTSPVRASRSAAGPADAAAPAPAAGCSNPLEEIAKLPGSAACPDGLTFCRTPCRAPAAA